MHEPDTQHALIFAVDEHRFALDLPAVERVVRAVEITGLPRAPEFVSGVINVQGKIMPVMNLRRRLGLPERKIQPGDQFVIAHTAARPVVLVVDEVCEIVPVSKSSMTAIERIAPGLPFIDGVIKLGDGLVLIKDVEKFLSPEEHKAIDDALKT